MIKLPQLQVIYGIISKFSKREKMTLYIASGVVALLLLDKLIVYPIYSSMRSLDNEITGKELTLKRDLRIIAQKDKIASEDSKYSSFVTAPKTEQEAVTALLKEIEGLAGKSSVYLTDMKPAGTKDIGGNKKYMVALTCEGKMEQITGFIYNVESSDKLLSVEKYQITPKSKDTDTAQCNMSVSQIVIP